LERVRKLEKSGYITGYFAQIAVNKCELDLVAMIEVSLEHSHTHIYQDFHKAIINHDEIEGIYQIAGDFDYIIKVRSKNMESYRHFLWNILAQAPGVKGTRSHMVMETIYERQTPSLKYLKDSIDTP
jgi:Lrp/AsnC family leucine-responsive transcriptional regulator